MQSLRSAIVLVLTIIVPGCASPSAENVNQPADAADANGHWVQRTKLRALMQSLGRYRFDLWPQEMEQDRRRQDDKRSATAMTEAESLAEKLAETAMMIPDAVDVNGMAEVDRRGFMAQVQTLYDQSLRLQKAAGERQVDRMRGVLQSIESTCNSCHHRFRDFAGPLNY
ncbi:MAG: cytochrome c [Planctomycetota bacterium]